MCEPATLAVTQLAISAASTASAYGAAQAQQAAYQAMISDPLGNGRPLRNYQELMGGLRTNVSSLASRKVMR